MGLPIMYYRGLKLRCISVPEDCLNLANSADPDEMQHYAASGSSLFSKVLVYVFPEYKGLIMIEESKRVKMPDI